MSERYAQVLLDLPGMVTGGGVFDYALPEEAEVQIGHRVVVPLGPRKVVGIVAGITDTTEVPASKVRSVQHVFNDVAPLSREWLRFIGFASDYYVRGVGETAMSALPQFFRTPPRARYDASMRSLRTLKGRAVKAVAAPDLNDEQKAAIEGIFAKSGFSVSMLFGVTGSGKTEVYLHAIERVLAANPENQVLMLVPEINLTPQLEARVRGRFQNETVVTMHSDLTPVQRARSWLAVHEGRARILVGTRLSVFASFH
ncbi:MAG: DEAD/DEAH box helicase, partial [Duodenibacillus sp.]